MSELYVSELAIYPVKSLAQIVLNESRIGRFGLEYDRQWMIVDKDGYFVTQRQNARMCMVQPEYFGNRLKLKAPGMRELLVTVNDYKTKHKVIVWEDECDAYDCGDEAAEWLSQFLAIDCRLMLFPEDEDRLVDQTYAEPIDYTAFSDGFPILLISQASLDDLNHKLEKPVSMLRFRPNLVVAGCSPYAEDGWKLLRIGDLTLRVVKPCSRCAIPNIDVATAKRTAEPAKTLSSYRKKNNKIFFGQNVIANGNGLLQKGMPVEILE